MSNSGVRAPYNFVPFSGKKPFLRYQDVRELPAHNKIREDLKTGEIQITLRAETPVFVSDGNKKNPHFFRGPDGKHMIPGSTLRGLLRENMAILGYGLVLPGEDMEDYRVYFREMAAARGSTGDKLKQYYRDALGIESAKSGNGKSYSIPTRVRSGYLFAEHGKYFIRPTCSPYLRVSRSDPEILKFGNGDARTVSVAYSNTGNHVTRVVPAASAQPGMQSGVLLFTGRPVGKIPNHLYLFPEADLSAPVETISDADILSYREDLESRKNSLKAYYKVEFWELPKEGERKPVFYTVVDGHTYFGMSLFLRVGYPHSLAEGLPKAFRDMVDETELPLDYPHAVLGFATDTKSYRSRVSVGDFPLTDGDDRYISVSAILGEPKPGYYPGYVKDGMHYAEEEFQLRGYKQYWLHEVKETTVPEGKEKVGTELKLLPAGCEFQGVIRFRNLTEDELGLLLWALCLQKDCYQTIGMGKPYGYGRIKLTIDALKEMRWSDLYGVTPDGQPVINTTERIDDYIRTFDEYISSKLYIKKPSKEHPSITTQPEIQDFFYIKSSIRPAEEVSYMELPEYKNTRAPLPTISDSRPKEEKPKEQNTKAEEDPFAALRNKFKGL